LWGGWRRPFVGRLAAALCGAAGGGPSVGGTCVLTQTGQKWNLPSAEVGALDSGDEETEETVERKQQRPEGKQKQLVLLAPQGILEKKTQERRRHGDRGSCGGALFRGTGGESLKLSGPIRWCGPKGVAQGGGRGVGSVRVLAQRVVAARGHIRRGDIRRAVSGVLEGGSCVGGIRRGSSVGGRSRETAKVNG
jgi:hypothetical protein